MKSSSILKAVALALGLVSTVVAADSPWSVRLRATYLQTADKSDAFTALAINFGQDAVSVSDKLIPEIDIAYAFTDVWSAELVLTIPQEHTVDLKGVGRLGDFEHLPPTLYLQYRANPGGLFRPYAGLGVNYTMIFDDDLIVAGVPLGLDAHSIGVAAQVGFDYKVNDRWSFNVDVKYAKLATGVYAGSAKLTEARLDPWLYAIGARYDF